jgi:hypothetical protein
VKRRAILIAAVIAVQLVVLFLVTAPAADQGSLIPSYASTDASPGGTLALRRWLADLGFQTRSLQGARFEVPSDTDVLFTFGPLEPWRQDEARRLREWVERGGRAIVASDRSFFDDELFAAFGAGLVARPAGSIQAGISPVLSRPAFRDLSSGTVRALRLDEPAAVLVADRDAPLIVERRIGTGVVYLSSASDLFLNGNLATAENYRFALNLLAGVRRGATIDFDEFHHGMHTEPTLDSLFTDTAPGRAALFAALMAFLYIVLRGRRFGAAVPLDVRPQRSSLDYVRSFAGLLRRSGARELAGERLARLYRRQLARAIGARPLASDEDVVAALGRSSPARATSAREVLAQLEHPASDAALLASAERAAQLAHSLDGA